MPLFSVGTCLPPSAQLQLPVGPRALLQPRTEFTSCHTFTLVISFCGTSAHCVFLYLENLCAIFCNGNHLINLMKSKHEPFSITQSLLKCAWNFWMQADPHSKPWFEVSGLVLKVFSFGAHLFSWKTREAYQILPAPTPDLLRLYRWLSKVHPQATDAAPNLAAPGHVTTCSHQTTNDSNSVSFLSQ